MLARFAIVGLLISMPLLIGAAVDGAQDPSESSVTGDSSTRVPGSATPEAPATAVATPELGEPTALSFTIRRLYLDGRVLDIPDGSEFVVRNQNREVCARTVVDAAALRADQTVSVTPRLVGGVSCGSPDGFVVPVLLFPKDSPAGSGHEFSSILASELDEAKVLALEIEAPGLVSGQPGDAPAARGLPRAGSGSGDQPEQLIVGALLVAAGGAMIVGVRLMPRRR
jgi:hypothetical protein